MGAWIEIACTVILSPSPSSRPSWARGLKSEGLIETVPDWTVAPLMGAWIEMRAIHTDGRNWIVAPLMGAWIEISDNFKLSKSCLSRPSWARGLK